MIDQSPILFPTLLFFMAALLYTSVGHGGASGYLAVMGLLGFSPALQRSTSLSLNIAAASIAFIVFVYRQNSDANAKDKHASSDSVRLLLPFLLTSLPMAYAGGLLHLQTHVHKPIVGLVLLWSAWQLMAAHEWAAKASDLKQHTQAPSAAPWWAWPAGALMGLLSGLTGVGGGIFLSPLLVLTGLCTVRQSAPLAAAFIVLNSSTGLLGVLHGGKPLAPELPYWIAAVILAAMIGASWGSRTLRTTALRRILGAVLLVAGAKLIATST